jgi:hypothetical protein
VSHVQQHDVGLDFSDPWSEVGNGVRVDRRDSQIDDFDIEVGEEPGELVLDKNRKADVDLIGKAGCGRATEANYAQGPLGFFARDGLLDDFWNAGSTRELFTRKGLVGPNPIALRYEEGKDRAVTAETEADLCQRENDHRHENPKEDLASQRNAAARRLRALFRHGSFHEVVSGVDPELLTRHDAFDELIGGHIVLARIADLATLLENNESISNGVD